MQAAGEQGGQRLTFKIQTSLTQQDLNLARFARNQTIDELIGQTYLSRSHDVIEFREARAEGREPEFNGS